jgi:hypothetical protein
LFPDFRSADVSAAMARVLPTQRQRFIDRWVLPRVAEIRRIRPPRRSVRLWRKACLMDSSARRIAFALSHAGATIRQWGAR